MLKQVFDAVGLTDSGASAKSMKQATALTREQMKRLDAIDLPDIEKMRIALQNPELIGLLETEQLGPSALEGITTDPRLKADMMAALEGLRERANTGLTEQDKFAMEELMGQVGAQEKSQRASIEQEMARRGTQDSGTALMAKLQGSAGGANNARQQAMQMAAQGQQQRMAALQGLGQQSSQMQAQDFAQQGQVASARDTIAQANAMNRQNVAAQNLAARQNIENQRANLSNQQQMYNKGLYQQQFQNELSKAGAQGQATGNLAGMYAQQAGAQAQADAAVMGGMFNLGAAFVPRPSASDIRVKEDIKPGSPSIRKMLDKLDPYEYDYKDEAIEDESMLGSQLGVMAQDLEESDLGEKFVQEDMNGVKRVDYGKMGSTQMAALADLHQRLKKLEAMLGNSEDEDEI
jgi:hypothetical protein